MRKLHQKQLLDILKTIKTAQEKKLYGDCQEGALSLCDFIDQMAGERKQAFFVFLFRKLAYVRNI